MTAVSPPDRATRHRTGRRFHEGDAVFAKRARGPAQHRELAREAAVYDLVRTRCPVTAGRIPGDVRWDSGAGELTMEALAGRDLASLVEDAGGLPVGPAAAVAEATAALHAEGRDAARDAPPSMWALGGNDWHRPRPGHLRLLSAGGMQLLEALQRSAPLCAHLRRIDRRRDGDTLIHGDLRWENVVVDAAGPHAPRVRLVDWELAGRGEAAWDVGCFVAAGLGAWLSTIPHVPGVAPARLADQASLGLAGIRPGLAAFWSGCAEAGEASRESRSAWAERCMELAAVRLVDLAFEATTDTEYLHSAPVAHLQVALNILDDPRRARRELLGVDG